MATITLSQNTALKKIKEQLKAGTLTQQQAVDAGKAVMANKTIAGWTNLLKAANVAPAAPVVPKSTIKPITTGPTITPTVTNTATQPQTGIIKTLANGNKIYDNKLAEDFVAPNGKKYTLKQLSNGERSFANAQGTNTIGTKDEIMGIIKKGNPVGSVVTQNKVDKNTNLDVPGFQMGEGSKMPDAESRSAMSDAEQQMWLQKNDQQKFIQGAAKTFGDFAANTIKGQADFKDAVNQKQKLLSEQLNQNVQNRYQSKAMDDANRAKVQDQVDATVKEQRMKLENMEKEFIKGQAEAKKAWDDYSSQQKGQADIETAGESAGAAASLTKAGLSGSAVSNAMAGIADKNHKRYVDLAKTNFDTAQALTKQYTDFYDKLVNQIGNVDATQRGVMETVVQSVSDKIKNLESMNKKYVDDMADPLHKYIDAQTTEYTAEAGSQAKTKANIASWEEADPKMREELIVNNLVRLAGSTPGFDVQLKSISPEELQSALKFPTLIQGLQSLVAKHPAIATAIKNAQSSTSSVGGTATKVTQPKLDKDGKPIAPEATQTPGTEAPAEPTAPGTVAAADINDTTAQESGLQSYLGRADLVKNVLANVANHFGINPMKAGSTIMKYIKDGVVSAGELVGLAGKGVAATKILKGLNALNKVNPEFIAMDIADKVGDKLLTPEAQASLKTAAAAGATMEKIKTKILEYKKAGKTIPTEWAYAYDTLYKQTHGGNAPKVNPAK